MSHRGKSGRKHTNPKGPRSASPVTQKKEGLIGKILDRLLSGDEASAPPLRKRPVVESLEPRLLLSTSPLPQPTFNDTLGYDGTLSLGAINAVLEVVDTGAPNLTLRLRDGGNILGQKTLDHDVRVAFTGSVFSDKLTLNLNYTDADGNPAFSPWSIKLDFDGGTDVPLLTDDQLIIQSGGPHTYQAGGLFVTSTDDILFGGALRATGDVDLQSAEKIDLQAGSSLQARDIRLAAVVNTTGGLAGTDIQANAAATVTLQGATLAGRNIGIDATNTITLNSQDEEFFNGQVKLGAVDANATATITLAGANVITATGTLALDANNTVTTILATAPDNTANATNKDAAVAVTHVNSAASVRVGGASSLNATGALTVASNSTVNAQTHADGGAGAQAGSAAGGTVAVAVIGGDTKAEIADTASLTGGTVTVSAQSSRTIDTQAKSTKGGATSGGGTPTTGTTTLQQQNAQTSDGSMTLAAAVAVTTVTGDSIVQVSTSGALNSGGALALTATSNVSGPTGGLTTVANGQNTTAGGNGIAAAVAINNLNAASQVLLTGGGSFSATGGVIGLATFNSALSGAQATSGAGAKGVGVAGALAINAGVTKAEAVLGATATITLSGNTSLSLKSALTTSDTAKAQALVTAGNNTTGVGASVAINVVDAVSRAVLDTGSRLTGANSAVALDAVSNNTVVTDVDGGAAGGTAISPAAAVTVANLDTLAEVRNSAQGLSVQSLALHADHTGTATTTADGAAQGADLALGMGLAFSSVVDTTHALLDRSATVGGVVNVKADSKQSSSSAAKASAKGGKQDDGSQDGQVDQQTGAQRGVGNTTAAGRGGRGSQAAGATPQAQTASTSGSASGSSSVNVAGAVAVNIGQTDAKASIGAGRTVTATGAAAIQSTADTDASATADGLATSPSSGTGVGAAVAINVGDVSNSALIGGGASLTAAGVTLSADGPTAAAQSVFGATTTAGAGGGDVGVAGSVAINVGKSRTTAQVAAGATVASTGAGAVTVKAGSNVQDKAEAKPKNDAQGQKVGIGASVAINVADDITRAAVESTGAVTSGGALSVNAAGKSSVVTTAEGGAAGGVAIVPVAAITVANLDTVAEVLGTGAFTGQGVVTIGATHEGTAATTATGKATGNDAAIGASVAVSTVTDTTRAMLDRNASTIGALNVLAASTQASTSTAKASTKGGQSDSQGGDQQGVDNQNAGQRKSGDSAATSRGSRDSTAAGSTPKAATADKDGQSSGSSSVSVAGAVAVDIATTRTQAQIGNALTGRTVSAGGAVTVKATADTDASAVADGSAVIEGNGNGSGGSGAGIGAAVAIAVGDVVKHAVIGQGSSVTGQGISVSAELSTAGAQDVFNAQATSGAGGGSVGVAGSLAITVGGVETLAEIDTGASLTLTGGGALNLKAASNTSDKAEAKPKGNAQGEKVGIGASVAIGVVDDTTHAWVDSTATVANAGSASITADSKNTTVTTAEGGAGGGVGIVPVAAVTVANLDTIAEVLGTGNFTSTGAVAINATHAGTATTTATGKATGDDAAIGASVAVGIANDTTQARLDRSATVGSLAIAAASTQASSSTAKASTTGGKSDSANNQDGVDKQNAGQRAQGDKVASDRGNRQSGAAGATPKAQTADKSGSNSNSPSSVSVAGAVAVNLGTSSTEASIGNALTGRTVVSTGAVSVKATADTDGSAVADGTAVVNSQGGGNGGNSGVGVGAAVAINAVDVVNTAFVGNNSSVTSNGLTVSADGPTAGAQHVFSATSTSGAGGGSVGVAGSLAINVVTVDTQARLGSGATIVQTGGGSVTLKAGSNSSDTAQAKPQGLAQGSSVGIGASVAINVVDEITRAAVENTASVTGAGGIAITADSKNAIVTKADGGAGSQGGNDTDVSIVPVAAVTVANLDTIAEVLGTGGFSTTGALSITATHAGTATTTATGKSTGNDAAIGASVGVGVVTDTTRALLDRSTTAGGAIGVNATSQQATNTTAKASVSGGQKKSSSGNANGVDDQKDGQRSIGDKVATERGARSSGNATDNPSAATAKTDSEGSGGSDTVAVAAAVVVNVADSSTTAATGAGRTITSGGVLSVNAVANTDASADADGAAVGAGSAGVGVAVAINVADVTHSATIGASNVIQAQGLSVTATTGGGEATPEFAFVAKSKSGAGADDVGVAGSLSINLVDVNSTAAVAGSASVQLGGGALTVRATQNTRSTAEATPEGTGAVAGSVGVGASVALNRVDTVTRAAVENGATLSGTAGAVTVEAAGAHNVKTLAKNGAGGGGGDVGVGAAVALSLTDHQKTALLGSGSALSATGNVSVHAAHASAAQNEADSEGSGSSVGVGASVGINVLKDTVSATAARSVTTAGSIAVASEVVAGSTNVIKASAQGNKGSGRSADDEADNQVNNNPNNGGDKQLPSAQSNVDSANSDSSSESSSESADVGVAAAVGVTSHTVSNTASVAGTAQLSSTAAAASVTATADVDASNLPQGSALDADTTTAIGAAVGVTAADVSNRATVAGGASVSGTDVTVSASTPAGGSSDFKTWALAAGGGEDNGLAGSVAINHINYLTEAQVAGGAQLTASNTLNVTATSTIGIQAVAGGAGVGEDVGVGVAVAIGIVNNDTLATVGNGAELNARGATQVKATAAVNPLAIPLGDIPLLPDSVSLTSVAAGFGASQGDAGVAGSLVVNVFNLDTRATLGEDVLVNQDVASPLATQHVTVQATDTTKIVSVAGAAAGAFGSSGVAVAAGVDVGVLNKNTRATVGRGSQIGARGNVNVGATSDEDIVSVAASAGASGSAAIGGSVSVYVVDADTHATLLDGTAGDAGAAVVAEGNVGVIANGSFTLDQVAGNVAIGSDAGIGLSNTTLVHNDVVEARVGSYTDVTTRGGTGLSVLATSSEDLVTIAAGGSGGGTAGVAGSAVVNILNETTRATVGDGAEITARTNVGGAPTPDVQVKASDITDIVAVGGSVSVGGTAGVGAGVSVGKFNKNTQASIGSAVTADVQGDIVVDARTLENVTSVAAAGAGGGTAGVAGSAGVLVLDVVTRAFIGDDPDVAGASLGAGDVHAQGSISIAADDYLDETNVAGSIGVGGTVGIGAAVGVPVVNKRVEAFVGAGAKVTADGQSAIDVATGNFSVGYEAAPEKPANVDVKNGNRPTKDSARFGPSQKAGLLDSDHDGTDDRGNDPLFSSVREAALAKQQGFRGLAISATNRDSVKNIVLSGGGAGVAAVSVAAGVNVFNTTASAYIGQGADVNASTAGANSAQSVLVGAGNDFYHLEVAGSVAVAASAGIAPAVGVSVIDLRTNAYIADAAKVNARNDIAVDAHAAENILLVSAGIGGGVAGVGGAISVPVINNITQAYIGQNARVSAGGDVAVLASDDTKVFVLSGAVGAGVAGIGASVGVTSLTKATSATIWGGAHVDALGANTGISGVLDGTANGTSSFNSGVAHGVIVQATTNEDVKHIAIAAGAGVVGIAGGVAITLIDSDTTASIEANAQINQTNGNAGASQQQGVTVRAANRVETFSFAGSLAGGLVGIAGAVDVGSVKNDTRAVVRGGAAIAARGKVAVGAHHLDYNRGFTLSAGGGFVGVAASVSVWSLGTQLSGGYQNNSNQSDNALRGGGGRADQQLSSQAGTESNRVGDLLGGYSSGNQGDSRTNANERIGVINQGAGSAVKSKGPSASTLQKLIDGTGIPLPQGTQAIVEAGASITSGGDITIDATDRSDAKFIVGAAGGGFVGVGAGVGVLNIANNARASSSGTLNAGGNIRINSVLQEKADQFTAAFGGGFVGLGASVSVMTVTSTSQAFVGNNGIVGSANNLDILASGNQQFSAMTMGGTVGAVAIGASFTRISVGNGSAADVQANIGANAEIGQSGSVGNVRVQASSVISTTLETKALAGGIVAGSFNFAFADIKPDVRAFIGEGAKVTTTGNIGVYAGTDHYAKTDVLSLTIGGAAGGLSLAYSTIDPDLYATVAGSIHAGGSLSVVAGHNVDPLTLQAIQHGGSSPGAYSMAEAPSVAVFSANASLARSYSTADVNAGIGSGADINVNGAVTLRADGVNVAKARGKGFNISLAGFSLLNAESKASGSNQATVGTDATIDGGSLQVVANGVDHAKSEDDSTNLSGLGSIGYSRATATVAPTVKAQIGEGVEVTTTGNVAVQAESITDGDAIANSVSASLGGAFGMVSAESNITPTVSATVASSAGNATRIAAGGAVSVEAKHGSPVSLSDGTLSGLNTGNDTLSTAQPHGLSTGDRIQYQTNGNAAVGGLVADRTYGVIVIDGTTVKLGNPFVSKDVSDAYDTIRFLAPHNLSTGDRLIYGFGPDGTGSTPTTIGGLVNGTAYYVRVIDSMTVKLGTSQAQVTQASKSFQPADVNPNTEVFTLTGHGFADGAAVTYRGPRTARFFGSAVDDTNEQLFIGAAPNDFQTGDRITYNVTGVDGKPAVAVGGLSNGASYYVYRVSADTIKLSVDPIENDGEDVFINLTRSEAADISQHSLVRFGEKAIGNLTDGKTYYVKRLDANTFQLAETSGGPAINVATAGVAGTQYIGVEGIDLTAQGVAGQHWLARDLTGALAGTQRLSGAGGIVGGSGPFGIDGVSYAKGIGPSFALLVAGAGADATVNMKPTVSATIGAAATVTAEGHITVSTEVYGNADTDAGVTTGAVVGTLGKSEVRVNFVQNAQTTIGAGATVHAGGNLSVTTENRHVATGSAYAGGGSAGVSLTGADAIVDARPTTLTTIGDNANLHADGDITLSARLGAKGKMVADSVAYSGLGSGGSTYSFWALGNAADDFNSPTYEIKVLVNNGAVVRAERKLTVQALLDETDIKARAEASAASAFYSDPDSNARAFVKTLSLVDVKAGARLTGVNRLDVLVKAEGAAIDAYAYSDGGSLFGGPDANAYAYHRAATRVLAEAGAVFASKDLNVEAIVQNVPRTARGDAVGFTLNPFDQPSFDAYRDQDWSRHITFNADVVLMAAPTPRLVVDANGNIVEAVGVTASVDATRIVVDNIDNNGKVGKARFAANAITVGNLPILGVIDGDQGTLTVEHSFETVEILNYSAKDLWVQGINPIDRTGRAKVDVEVDLRSYFFDIVHSYTPTRIDILNLGTTGAADVYLHGLIDNPIGTTNVTASRGDVWGTSLGTTRSNIVNIVAATNVGLVPPINFGQFSIGRVEIELVQSQGRPTDLTLTAGGNAYVGLRLLQRDNSGVAPVLKVGTFQTGGDSDIIVREARRQTTLTNTPSGYLVDVTETNPWAGGSTTAAYANHFKPDGGGPVFAPPLGIFGSGSTLINHLARFDLIKAGGNIKVVGAYTTTRIDILANTDITGAGHIDVDTNGDVTLVEIVGDLRAGRITSDANDVTLTAAAGIKDALADAEPDVEGNTLTLTALAGSIGTYLNDLEVDSQNSVAGGTLIANATSDVYVWETRGSLLVEQVASSTGDVRLTTTDARSTGDDIQVGQGHSILAFLGAITLQAGDNINVNGEVRTSGRRLTFRVDYRNNDEQGGFLSTRGVLQGGGILMEGDEDDDTLDVTGHSIVTRGYGHGGNDNLVGGTQGDELYGGEGTDRIDGREGDDLIVAGNGVGDILFGGSGNDTVYGSPEGSNADPDFTDTTRFGDVIDGGEGDDLIHGQGGADDIRGGAGQDWIDGGSGNDLIRGGAGADTIYGHLGNDVIYGFDDPANSSTDDAALDNLYGEWGDDIIHGGAGSDAIDGGFGNDVIFGRAGNDIIRTGFGANTVDGGDGDDAIYGSDDGSDVIDGGGGDDRIWGYAGNDVIDGNRGKDIIDAGAGDDLVSGGAGADVIVGGAGHDTLYGHSANGSGDDNAVDHLYGDFGTGKDEAGSGNDRLYGQGGNDLLFGEGGDDYIAGTSGFNQTEGSGGTSNVIDFGDSSDTVSFVAGVPTAAPALKAIDYTLSRAALQLPDGMVQRGRWADLGGTADGDGLSGTGGFSSDPVVAVSGTAQYVAWTDTRTGTPQIIVAKLQNGVWTRLGGVASGSVLGAGASGNLAASFDPSIVIDGTGAPIVVWTAEHNGLRDIRAARFDAATQTWVALGGSLTTGGLSNTGIAESARVVMTANGPVVVWLNGAADAKSIHARIFTGGSWTEIGAGSATGTGLGGGLPAFDVEDLAVASDGNRVAVAWSQDFGDVRQIYLKEYTGGTAGSWAAVAGSASGSGVSGVLGSSLEGVITHNATPSVTYFQGRLFVAWQTFADQGTALAVASYSNTAVRTLTVHDTFGLAYGHDVPAQPQLTAGGNALRLVWLREPDNGITSDLYVRLWNGSHFVEEVPTEASGAGASITGRNASDLAVATDASGRTIVVWQDNQNGEPEVYARGMTATIGRTFVADASQGTTVQSILDGNDLGAGDAIIVIGQHGNVSIAANDAGVAIYGSPGSSLGTVSVAAGADNVLLSRVTVDGVITVNGANNFTVTESELSGVVLNGGSGAQILYSQILDRTRGSAVVVNGAVTNALIDHSQLSGLRILPLNGQGAVNLTVSNNRITTDGTALSVGVAASGRIRDNVLSGQQIGLDLANVFTGLIDGNTITGAAIGVRHDTVATLAGNTITGNTVGIRTTVGGTTQGLGFTTGSQANVIENNDTGIVAVNAQFQLQTLRNNTIGVSGSGIIGGGSLELANVFEGNQRGVTAFTGLVQYSRFTANDIAVDVTAAMKGLKIWHNIFDSNTRYGVLLSGTSDIRIYQNTFYARTGDNIHLEKVSSNIEIQGNILWAEGGYDIYVANDSQAGFYSDYNNLYKTGHGRLVYWTKDFLDVLDWQADVARYDLHSIGATVVNPDWAKPAFVDLARGDLRLFDTTAGLRFTSSSIEASNAALDQSVPPHYGPNLLANGSFENGTTGWSVNAGGGVKGSSPGAYDGAQFYAPGSIEQGFATQTINLLNAGFSAALLDSGLQDISFGGRLRTGATDPRDAGSITVKFLDAGGNLIRQQVLNALNTADRWELVSGRVAIPTGARFAEFRFDADRNAGSENTVVLDSAFVYAVADAYAPNLGAWGAGNHEPGDPTARKIMLRFPDLYTDWEKNEPLAIRWETVNNTSNSPVRIDLIQDTPDGPKFVTNIVASTIDDGEFVWIPGNHGIDFGTKGLRIQVSLVQAPEVIDRSQENFSVPEDGTNYYVDDQSNTGDAYTPNGWGDNRHTGKTPDAPKPNPVNVFRAYDLKAGDTLYIDTGNYPMIDPIAVSGSQDVSLMAGPGMGRDEGFTITGPVDVSQIARLFPAIPGDKTRPLIYLNDADFVSINHLTLENAHRGIYATNNSDSFSASYITASGHTQDGIWVQGASPFGDFDHLASFNNGGHGVYIEGAIDTLTRSTAYGNAKTGFTVTGRVNAAVENIAHTNNDWGFAFTGSGAALIQRNTAYGNRAGLYVYNNVSGTVTTIGGADLALGNGNLVFNNRDVGIQAEQGVLVAGNTVYGHKATNAWGISARYGATVQSNVVFNNTQGVYVHDGAVLMNRVYANTGTGIESSISDTIGNTVYSNAIGLRLTDTNWARENTARNNIVYANTEHAVLISGDKLTFINNTVYQAVGDAVRLDNAANVRLYNNVLGAVTGSAIVVNANSQIGFASDYNLFIPSAAGSVGVWQGTARGTLAAWRAAAFTDANSLTGNPHFADIDGADNVLGYVNAANDGRDDDFHEASLYGGFRSGSGLAPVVGPNGLPVVVAPTAVVNIAVQSPLIDRGRAVDDYSNEPAPNGGYINIGAYGNTAQAGRSPGQYITVLSPNGGERIGQNSTAEIRWRSFGFTGNVNIEYRGAGQASFVTLAANEANDGSWNWLVDGGVFAPAANYEIRITSVSTPAIVDTSDAQFEVLSPIHYYYVNDGALTGDEYTTAVGNDANDGLTPDKPKASIRSVLDTYDLNPGDIILVDTGNYLLGTNIFIVTQDSGVVIRGAVNGLTTLDRGNTNA
ncbi:LEPR-XLL domain-containing protein, partial [Aquabacterium soli]